jgi:tryptophan synthase alpha chain
VTNRLDALFAERRTAKSEHEKNEKNERKVLVAYLCVGDPSVDESIGLAQACVDAGADVLELGVPFSDPTADGPTIARASQRAIRAGGGLAQTIDVARSLRDAGCEAPIVLFGYFNPLFVRGEERSIDDAADAGIDALLIVDLPLHEGQELRARAAARNVAIIPLLTPTSSDARVEEVRALAASTSGSIGFVYYVSVTGVTGSGDAPLLEASRTAARLQERHGAPTVIGFGIDTPEKARTAARLVDGVVVGTAIVRQIEEGKTPEERISRVTALVRALRQGLDST